MLSIRLIPFSITAVVPSRGRPTRTAPRVRPAPADRRLTAGPSRLPRSWVSSLSEERLSQKGAEGFAVLQDGHFSNTRGDVALLPWPQHEDEVVWVALLLVRRVVFLFLELGEPVGTGRSGGFAVQ